MVAESNKVSFRYHWKYQNKFLVCAPHIVKCVRVQGSVIWKKKKHNFFFIIISIWMLSPLRSTTFLPPTTRASVDLNGVGIFLHHLWALIDMLRRNDLTIPSHYHQIEFWAIAKVALVSEELCLLAPFSKPTHLLVPDQAPLAKWNIVQLFITCAFWDLEEYKWIL